MDGGSTQTSHPEHIHVKGDLHQRSLVFTHTLSGLTTSPQLADVSCLGCITLRSSDHASLEPPYALSGNSDSTWRRRSRGRRGATTPSAATRKHSRILLWVLCSKGRKWCRFSHRGVDTRRSCMQRLWTRYPKAQTGRHLRDRCAIVKVSHNLSHLTGLDHTHRQ